MFLCNTVPQRAFGHLRSDREVCEAAGAPATRPPFRPRSISPAWWLPVSSVHKYFGASILALQGTGPKYHPTFGPARRVFFWPCELSGVEGSSTPICSGHCCIFCSSRDIEHRNGLYTLGTQTNIGRRQNGMALSSAVCASPVQRALFRDLFLDQRYAIADFRHKSLG